MINFFKGLLIGITMALPIGPLSILCISRSLTKGHIEGFATALGIALADGFYALVAALGLATISSFILGTELYLFMLGGILLLILGTRTLVTPSIRHMEPEKHGGFLVTLLQTMVLTLTNPMTIVTFIAAFVAAGFEGHQQTASQALLICLGVFSGSIVWFIFLSIIASYFRHHVTPFMLQIINLLSGFLLIIFGAVFFLHGLRKLFLC